jgi:predicted nucleic acid-binding protein
MTGVDTNVLVCLAFQNHVGNSAARTALENELQAGHHLALTSPVISEFLHVVTDSRRFPDPLTMDEALAWITQIHKPSRCFIAPFRRPGRTPRSPVDSPIPTRAETIVRH